MSLSQQTSSRNISKEQPVRQTNQTAKASTAETPPPRMVRLTVSLPGELVDRLRNAVYWSPGLTLAWLIAKSLQHLWQKWSPCSRNPFHDEPLRSALGALDWSVRSCTRPFRRAYPAMSHQTG